MSAMDPDERLWLKGVVAEAVREELDRRRSVDEATHRDDHEYLAAARRRRARWDERAGKIVDSLLGSVALGTLAALGWAVAEAVRVWFRR